jgi:branched-chain amino acid transport system permease protein
MQWLTAYQPILDFFLLSVGFAFSQQVALRAGVFSIATAGFASLGAYACSILVKKHGFPAIPSVVIALAIGSLAGWLLSLPLSRLRGVYQAIASLAFVEVIGSLALYAEPLTGGAIGINNIPKLVTTSHLVVIVAVVLYVMHAIGSSGIGRSFDALRQDETVATCLGVSIVRYHALAFILSGALGGLFGALQALYAYNVEPSQFGFAFMVAALTSVVLGGRSTLAGPVVGAAVLTLLPEIARPLAENRPLVNGVILIAVIVFLPAGLGDGIFNHIKARRAALRRAVARRTHGVA